MITQFLSTAINQLLKNDPAVRKKLKALENKVITLKCTLPIPIIMQCTVNQQDVSVLLQDKLPSDTIISGTPLQLFRVSLLKIDSEAFQLDELTIEGDVELAESWLRLFREADIDLEEMLASYIGDVPAHKTNDLLQRFKKAVANTYNAFEVSMHDYLHEESDWFPEREALSTFFDDVDKIRQDADRLDAKIAIFSKKMKDHP